MNLNDADKAEFWKNICKVVMLAENIKKVMRERKASYEEAYKIVTEKQESGANEPE